LAAWITLAAIQAGPVSLVTAIIGTRPVFVFLIGVFLSTPQVKLLDEQTQRNVLLRKTFSILLIVTGVAIISTGSAI
jgi:drug/metabolite transporter (DMT)-like permease